MAETRIRPARPADAPAIAQLHTASWKKYYRGILPDAVLDELTVEESEARHTRSLTTPGSPEHRAWALVADGGVIGWAATGPARDDDLEPASHELYAIYLRPERVGQGHGRALMQHCMEDAGSRGFGEMVMWVLRGNERAQRFYTAAGFAPDPRVAEIEFRNTGATKLRMVRPIAQA